MKKLSKVLLVLVMASALVVPSMVGAAAGDITFDDITTGDGEAEDISAGLGDRDPRDIAASLIQVILGFLGILAVVIILIGGFKWMTAAGNEDQVAEARKIIVAGIIGLVIILAAWGIANFVLESLLTATTTG